MSTQEASNEEVKDEVELFLKRNFPQIEIHGGDAAVEYVDLEENEVSIELGGACSGCGVSPMTVQAIKRRLTKEIELIDTVHAAADGITSGETKTDAPF